MKCKIFSGTQITLLEKDINQWLQENSSIKIVTIVQSESSGSPTGLGKVSAGVTVTIFYEEG